MIGVFATLLACGSATASASGNDWKRVTIERVRGRTEATLSYETRASDQRYRRMTLVVRRSGTVVIDWLFEADDQAGVTLTLRNVWGDSDPEAIVQIRPAARATCCAHVGVALVGAAGSRVVFRNFDNGAGTENGMTAASSSSRHDDDASSASSPTAPVHPAGRSRSSRLNASATGFVDVTRSRPDLIAADAANSGRATDTRSCTRSIRGRTTQVGSAPMGVLAPWCGDEYLLGREDECGRALQQALAKGYLNGNWGGQGAINSLERTLATWHYDRR